MGLANLRRETRGVNGALDLVSVWGSDADLFRATGVTVSQASAMCQTAIFDAVHVIADPVSTFPISGPFHKVGDQREPLGYRPRWVDTPEPDPAIAKSDHYQALVISLLLNGNYYGRILRDASDEVVAVAVMDPTTVEPQRNQRTGLVEFRTRERVLPASDVVHITETRKPGAIKGTSRVDELAKTLGIGKALDDYVSRYFTQGTLTSVVIEVPGEMDEPTAERLKDRFEEKSKGLRNAHRPNVISGGGKVTRLGDNSKDAQLTEARDFFVLEVARAFKIPPSKLAVNTPGTRAYASIEQDNIDFVTGTLQFYVNKIEEAYSPLLGRPGAFIKLNMNALLRGDTQTRFGAYSQALDAGWIAPNEVRALEDLPPIEGGNELRVPLENINLSAAGLVELDKRVAIFTSLVGQGADPASAAAAAGLPAIEFTTPADTGAEARRLSVAEAVQKVYLGVGKVITSDEARQIVNGAGADLALPGPDFPAAVSGPSAA